MLRALCLMLFLCATQTAVSAAELKVGDTLPTITLKDQHDKAITVASDAKTLLFAVEKPAADIINDYLQKQDKDFLTQQKAYFLLDISGMPSMITQMFALPKMRERPYSILLAYDANEVAFMPKQKDHITIVTLQDNKVTEIEFVGNAEAFASALQP